MVKSELIAIFVKKQPIEIKEAEEIVKCIIEQTIQALTNGERVEIRGFGSFSLHYQSPRMGRNPKTGESIALSSKHTVHFKVGKELREKVRNAVNGVT